MPEPLLTDRVRELADKPGEEEAFEAALRAELEEERRRMEVVERELAEEPPGAPQTAVEEQERAEPRSGTGAAQVEAEPRSWWRRVFGG